MIARQLQKQIEDRISKGRAIVLLGARRTGKTTLIAEILANVNSTEKLILNGDNPVHQALLQRPSLAQIKNMMQSASWLFIDEAQQIDHIGITSKLIIDELAHIQVILSGSSALNLNEQIKESLTGRKWEFQLFPITYAEYEAHVGYVHATEFLESRMLFGWYPEVVDNPGDEIAILQELSSSYLYKDILLLGGIRRSEIIVNLVRLLAYQIGSEVSYQELARNLGVDKNTVANYINLLEKAYVIFRLSSYSNNHRNEIKKGKKIYFYDVGIRNAVIDDFQPLATRQDKGQLWENFIISELYKKAMYDQSRKQFYFWRTTRQQEIDLIVKQNSVLQAIEIKLAPRKSRKIPKAFSDKYGASYATITRENYRQFLIDDIQI